MIFMKEMVNYIGHLVLLESRVALHPPLPRSMPHTLSSSPRQSAELLLSPFQWYLTAFHQTGWSQTHRDSPRFSHHPSSM